MTRDTRRDLGRGTGRSVGVLACTLGGLAWALLGPAAVLERTATLGYDTYNRLLTLPLLLFLAGVTAGAWLLRPRTTPGTIGFIAVVLGLALLLVGNVVEFWGVLLQSQPNARTASETGAAEHWIGSDIGWITFGFGMLILLVGGVVLALSHWLTSVLPPWATLFLGLLGVGVLAGNLVVGAPFFVSIPILGLYGVGWIGLGQLLRRAAVPAASGIHEEPRHSIAV